jgi:hypothetical protein
MMRKVGERVVDATDMRISPGTPISDVVLYLELELEGFSPSDQPSDPKLKAR